LVVYLPGFLVPGRGYACPFCRQVGSHARVALNGFVEAACYAAAVGSSVAVFDAAMTTSEVEEAVRAAMRGLENVEEG